MNPVGVKYSQIGNNKFLRIFIAIFFAGIPLTPEGGTMVDEHSDVQDAMVPPSGVRGTIDG